MVIVNASKSTIVFKLDNGETMMVESGKASTPFLPSPYQIQCILAGKKVEEIALVMSSDRELELLRNVSGAYAFVRPTLERAKAELFEGKTFGQGVSENSVELAKAKAQIEDLNKSNAELERALKSAKEELDNSPVSDLEVKLDNAQRELAQIKLAKEEVEANYKTLSDQYAAAQGENMALADQLAKANDALAKAIEASKSAVADTSEIEAKHAAEVEELKAKIVALESDGAKVADGYKKAKDALNMVMDKFHINYVNGEFIQEVAEGAAENA